MYRPGCCRAVKFGPKGDPPRYKSKCGFLASWGYLWAPPHSYPHHSRPSPHRDQEVGSLGEQWGYEWGGGLVRVSLEGQQGATLLVPGRRPTQEFPVSIDPSGNCLESLQYFFFLRPYLRRPQEEKAHRLECCARTGYICEA
ncbi:hypothetical protein Pmani_037898 [Petrolisthes manimaculis]|uniref:Uncharacterized protein n=1 Tax=Petrolisthes manimaculis TaxID=1843537 RepID=A0AAE1NGC1_9EUCA|nr:hypothetical protein Pmani_037898 [Petrolisthes manimaculis]